MKPNSQLVSLSILLCILAFGSSANAQTKREITENEYWQAFRAANDAKNKVPYRTTSVEETYENGKVIGVTKNVYEQISADVTRYVHESKYNGKSETREVIQTGKFFYCRENSKAWSKAEQRCGPYTLRGIPAKNEAHFTLEETKLDGQDVKLYLWNAVFDGFDGKRRFSEDKFWKNNLGYTVREENLYGLEKDKEVTSKEIVTYEYNPKDLKIVAPIK